MPIRTRIMVINQRELLIHLPIPYTGEPGEESNFVGIVQEPLRVHIYHSCFHVLWDSLT